MQLPKGSAPKSAWLASRIALELSTKSFIPFHNRAHALHAPLKVAHKRYSTSFMCAALLGISSRQAMQRAIKRSPWTHFDPAAGVDNEWYRPMMRRVPPGKISHR